MNKAHSVITLEKVRDLHGDVPVGTEFTYSYKSKTRDQALQSAAKWLTVYHPGEDRLDWREVR